MKLCFDRFSRNTQMSNFIQIHPPGAKLLLADGRADRHDHANSRFFKFFESACKMMVLHYLSDSLLTRLYWTQFDWCAQTIKFLGAEKKKVIGAQRKLHDEMVWTCIHPSIHPSIHTDMHTYIHNIHIHIRTHLLLSLRFLKSGNTGRLCGWHITRMKWHM